MRAPKTRGQGTFKTTQIVLLTLPVLLLSIFANTAIAKLPAIKVGTTVSFSGVYAAPAKQQFEGIRMWVDDLNARGALLGRRVELVSYDDSSDAAKTARLYERLITVDQVDLLIGPYSSELTMAASQVAEAYNFPMVAAAANSSAIWSKGYKNIFQVGAPAADFMNLAIQSAAQDAGLKRIALIYADTDFSKEVAAGTRAQAAKFSMDIVFEAQYSLDNPGFSQLVARIQSSNPDMVIGATYLNDSIAFVRQAKKSQLAPKAMVFTVGPALEEFYLALGDDADGVLGAVSWMRTANLPMAQDFSYRYKLLFGRNAGGHAAYGYAAGEVLEAGVRLADTLVKKTIRQQLRQMKFRSLLGRYSVDETGRQKAKSIYVMQWQNGRRVLVMPKTMRQQPIIYPFTPWSER